MKMFFQQWVAYSAIALFFFYLNTPVNADTDGLLTADIHLQKQREYYALAKAAFERDDETSYRQLKTKLQQYPLYPYLEYNELVKQLDQLTYLQIDQFLEQYNGSYLADSLRKRWLQQLATKEDWQGYKNYYTPDLNATALHCHYLWAQLKTEPTNKHSPLYAKTTTLWNVGKSQPNQCDTLFDQWRGAGHLTPEIAWERHKKAIRRGNHSLGGYISRSMPKAMQPFAELYRRIDRHPQVITKRSLFHENNSMTRDILLRGLTKYAWFNAKYAHTLWQQYSHRYTFTVEEHNRIKVHIATQLARQGDVDQALAIAKSADLSANRSYGNNHANMITSILRELLKQQRWRDITIWIEQLPETKQKSDRWRYWQARSLGQTQASKTQAKRIYKELSAHRSYYGFLAADQIGSDYSFEHRPALINSQTESIKALPSLQRALELFAIGKMYAARHEWVFGVKYLSSEEHIAAAQLATDWGWNRKAIESMAAAKYWDDLDIRFPLVHSQWVDKAAVQTQLSDTLIYAIARQESSWATDALSPAGAIGLMQLMPNTAKQTTGQMGIAYRRKQLFQPEYNIAVGSRYMHNMINRYDGNRLLAIAAYNAGPSRVSRWLKDADQPLPYDVWIETIPFKETRKYVQNVLTYAVIYGYRMGQSVELITREEARQLL